MGVLALHPTGRRQGIQGLRVQETIFALNSCQPWSGYVRTRKTLPQLSWQKKAIF